MTSIIMEETIAAAPEKVWAALSDFANAHRPFAGMLSDCTLEGDDVRVATFANGMKVRERLIGVDHERKRIAYSVLDFAHHNASFEVRAHGDGSRIVWSCDVFPHQASEQIRPLMQAGLATLKRNLS